MGLHDRIKSQNGQGNGQPAGPLDRAPVGSHTTTLGEKVAERAAGDPYAELKTRIHHACIAKLGPQLFGSSSESGTSNDDLNERVLRAVTEQLALDRTPLTREERRQITREITDDILGYGPLEPLLRDDSVTEVMVNNDDRVVTIEDAAELQLQQDHVITLESRPPNIEGQGEIRIRELVRNALRMRPDRIIVGEVRGPETL